MLSICSFFRLSIFSICSSASLCSSTPSSIVYLFHFFLCVFVFLCPFFDCRSFSFFSLRLCVLALVSDHTHNCFACVFSPTHSPVVHLFQVRLAAAKEATQAHLFRLVTEYTNAQGQGWRHLPRRPTVCICACTCESSATRLLICVIPQLSSSASSLFDGGGDGGVVGSGFGDGVPMC